MTYSQNWDATATTAGASLPSNWTVYTVNGSTTVATDTTNTGNMGVAANGAASSSPNVLLNTYLNASNVIKAVYGVADGLAGAATWSVVVGTDAGVTNDGGEVDVWLVGRRDTATGAYANGYELFFQLNAGNVSGAHQVLLRRMAAGTETVLATVGGGIAPGGAYRLTLTCAANNTISAAVQRLSDSKWLTSAGAWQTGQATIYSAVDSSPVTTGSGGGYASIEHYNGFSTAFQGHVWTDDFGIAAISSPLVAGTLSAPSGVSASAETLTWTGPTGGGGSYTQNLQRSTDGTTFADVSGATSSPATATGLTASTLYYWRVRQPDGTTTVYTNTVSATTSAAGSPSFTTNPTNVVTGANRTLALTGTNTAWSTSSTTQFTLSMSGGATGASIVSQSASSATSATLVVNPGTAAGTLTITGPSGATATVTVTGPVPLVAPALAVGAAMSGAVNLTWTAATGGTAPYSYQVQRATLSSGVVGTFANAGLATSALSQNDTTVAAGGVSGGQSTGMYVYLVQATDSAGSPATATSNLVDAATPAASAGVLQSDLTNFLSALIYDPTSPIPNDALGVGVSSLGLTAITGDEEGSTTLATITTTVNATNTTVNATQALAATALPAFAPNTVGGLPAISTVTYAGGGTGPALAGVQLASSEHLAFQGDTATGVANMPASQLTNVATAVGNLVVDNSVALAPITLLQTLRYTLAKVVLGKGYSVTQGSTRYGQPGGSETVAYLNQAGSAIVSTVVTCDPTTGLPYTSSTTLS